MGILLSVVILVFSLLIIFNDASEGSELLRCGGPAYQNSVQRELLRYISHALILFAKLCDLFSLTINVIIVQRFVSRSMHLCLYEAARHIYVARRVFVVRTFRP
jgi:hypothetical protein